MTSRSFPVLDGHVHWGEWSGERSGWPGCDLDSIRAALRRAGIDGCAVMPSDTGDNEALAEALAPDPKGFHLFAWVHAGDPERTMRFLEQHNGHLAGLKIHPSVERKAVTDAAWKPFLRYAERWRLPVIVHSGRWQEIASWRFCLEVAERHPEASIIVAHLGGDLPELQRECAREMAVRALPNAYLGTESIREYYSIRLALDLLGPDRLLFGSDYPLGWPAAYLAVLDGADPSDEARRLVLGENLLRLIRGRRIE